MYTFSIIIPTKGRETLARTLASVCHQLAHGDEILVMRLDCEWGNKARDMMVEKASGTHLMFIDDDDAYLEGALQTVRERISEEPDRVHFFQMRYKDGKVLWGHPSLVESNVGTPMIVVPNGVVGLWENKGGTASDFHFMVDTMSRRGDEPVWHEDVIAVIRP